MAFTAFRPMGSLRCVALRTPVAAARPALSACRPAQLQSSFMGNSSALGGLCSSLSGAFHCSGWCVSAGCAEDSAMPATLRQLCELCLLSLSSLCFSLHRARAAQHNARVWVARGELVRTCAIASGTCTFVVFLYL